MVGVVEGFLLKISDSNVSVFGFSAEAHGNGMKVKRTFLWTLRWYDAMLVGVLLLSVGSPPGWHTNLNRPALFLRSVMMSFIFLFTSKRWSPTSYKEQQLGSSLLGYVYGPINEGGNVQQVFRNNFVIIHLVRDLSSIVQFEVNDRTKDPLWTLLLMGFQQWD